MKLSGISESFSGIYCSFTPRFISKLHTDLEKCESTPHRIYPDTLAFISTRTAVSLQHSLKKYELVFGNKTRIIEQRKQDL